MRMDKILLNELKNLELFGHEIESLKIYQTRFQSQESVGYKIKG